MKSPQVTSYSIVSEKLCPALPTPQDQKQDKDIDLPPLLNIVLEAPVKKNKGIQIKIKKEKYPFA